MNFARKITIFTAQSYKKIPLSPYGDKTFVFNTIEVQTPKEMFNILVSNFALNIPLNLSKPVRTFRRKVDLNKFYGETLNYFVLDLDHIRTRENMKKVLKFFEKYQCCLGQSKSYDGISNFNLKGVLFTREIQLSSAKRAISELNADLHKFCDVDEHVSRKVSLNAPINKNEILLLNNSGTQYEFKQDYGQYPSNVLENSKINVSSDLLEITAKTVEQFCLKVFAATGFTALKTNDNSSVTFKHTTETKSPGGYFWFNTSPFTMHHANSLKTVDIYDCVRQLPKGKQLLQKTINYSEEFEKVNNNNHVITVCEQFLSCTEEIETAVTQFLNSSNGLFSIRSPMGTGKSTLIKHVIAEAHELDMSVLVVTNRISVATDFGEKYNVKVYNNDKYNTGDSLICQYDSLCKYNIKNFDVVIMDEFVSLMLHSRNNLTNNSLNVSKFFGAFNKKLLIADAFLTGYENFLFEHKTENAHFVDNVYRDDAALFLYDDHNHFVKQLVLTARQEKCTVSTTSLGFLNALQSLLVGKGLRVCTLTADTPKSSKLLLYKLFESDHDKFDVLIFSPTLTVGVSIMTNVKSHWHFDSSMSSDVVSSAQMIKRVRKAKQIHLFVKHKINYVRTSYTAVRDEYAKHIGKSAHNNFLFDIDDYGDTKLSNVGKKCVKIDTFKNILESNHREGFLWLLKWHFLNEPTVIPEKYECNMLTKHHRDLKNNENKIKHAKITEYLKMNEYKKSQIMTESTPDKILKIISAVDEQINVFAPGFEPTVKHKIMDAVLTDSKFTEKCKFFNFVKNFSENSFNAQDVNSLVNRAVTAGDNASLKFYNTAVKICNNPVKLAYSAKEISMNRKLKFVLEQCGYKFNSKHSYATVGQRVFSANTEVLKFHKFIV